MALQLISKSERTHQSVFMERYAWMLDWAMKLTRGDAADAEDILHDAYLSFIRHAPLLDSIDNIDAYLNRMVRNLHLSRVMRRGRLPLVQLDALEYDSVRLSTEAVDPFKSQPFQMEIVSICDWGCARRARVKSAGMLLLRYFLDYLPSEIAAVCKCNRQTVEKSLQLARREIRAGRNPQSSTNIPASAAFAKPGGFSAASDWRTLVASIRAKIFSSASGECLPRTQLESLYEDAEAIETERLAHLTGCERCLDIVNEKLAIPKLAERSMLEDRRNGEPPTGGGSGASRLQARGDRSAKRIFEHRPSHLVAQIDAGRCVGTAVHAAHNRLELEAGRSGKITFLEIFSEQNVRLLYMPVTPPDEGGDYLQELQVQLSDDRRLHMEVCFTSPRPTVTVTYINPLGSGGRASAEAGAPAQLPVFGRQLLASGSARQSPRDGWSARVSAWLTVPFANLRRGFSAATAAVLIAALVLWQTHGTTMQAETLLSRAANWERTAAPGTSVLHRTFEYSEVPVGPHSALKQAVHRRLEVWRQPLSGRKESRLLDDSGKLVAQASGQVSGKPRIANAWQFEPSADTFRMALSSSPAKVVEASDRFEIRGPNAILAVDKSTSRPDSARFHLSDRDVEFGESTTESLPLAATPLAVAASPAAPLNLSSSSASAGGNTAADPVDLDLSELRVRSRLHSLQADLGEDLHIERSGGKLQVHGVIAEAGRRAELIAALQHIPGIDLQLRSPEQAAATSNAKTVRVVDSSQELDSAPLLDSLLLARYPDATARWNAVQHALKLSDQCLGRSHAIDQLERRYQGSLDAAASELVADDARQLEAAARELEQWLREIQPDTPAAAEKPQRQATPADTAAILVRDARDLDGTLAALLAIHASDRTQDASSAAATERALHDIREMQTLSRQLP